MQARPQSCSFAVLNIVLALCISFARVQAEVLFPSGKRQGDTRATPIDDGSYSVTLSQQFLYYGSASVDLYVNTNGILSFRQPFTDFQSRSFPFDSPPLIAPFWDDVDLVQSGDIFYRETNDSTLLMRVHDNITATFPTEDSFVPTHLFIATWDSVPQYLGDSDEENTFQIVLSTNGERSFVFFIYEDIEWGNAIIGFNAGNRNRFLMVLRSPSEGTEDTSNVGVPGLYIFRVDTPTVLPNGVEFDQETYTVSEFQSSVEVCVVVAEGLQFGGVVTISTGDGTALMDEDYQPITRDFTFDRAVTMRCVQIPILRDSTMEGKENFSVHITTESIETDSASIEIVDEDVAGVGFEQSVYIVQESQDNVTVSITINATLGENTGNIEVMAETQDVTAKAGSDYSRTTMSFIFNSTLLFRGRYEFAIPILTSYDHSSPEGPETFLITLISDAPLFLPTATVVILDTHSFYYPYGNRESESVESTRHNLSQNYPFFGENETTIFVSTNGLISFRMPYTNEPSLFPLENTTLIAPFWVAADCMQNHTVYYQETNEPFLLQRVHNEVQEAFLHIWNFFPTTLFTVTWDHIAECDVEQETNTFQVVMATDGELSFVFFIYGDILWGVNVTIGFNAGSSGRSFQVPQPGGSRNIETSSNIEIPGLFLYRVDQPNIITPENCTIDDHDVRLVMEGTNQGEGIVETCSMNQWERQLCADENSDDTATDICTQLGFLGGSAAVTMMNGSGSLSAAGSGGLSGGSNPCDYLTVRCEVASVGLEDREYMVVEDTEAGFLMVCVVLNAMGGSLERRLMITLLAIESGTASASSDFSPMSTLLIFGPGAHEQRQCVEISISDDNIVEGNETFLVLLTTTEQAVRLDRQYVFVTIVDDDEALVPVMTSGTAASFTGSLSPTLTSTPAMSPIPTASSSSQDAVAAALVAVIVPLMILLVVVAIILIVRRRRRKKKFTVNGSDIPLTLTSGLNWEGGVTNPYTLLQQAVSSLEDSESFKEFSANMLIPSKSIHLRDSIGQGEFGIVYKGHLTSGHKRLSAANPHASAGMEPVAVKTLKGFYDQQQVCEMLRESLKMKRFNHPNVLCLIGVCLDGGPAPYIVLPFMANGSLHSYLKKERPNLVLGRASDEEEVSAVSKRLLDMCLQIAKGMEYLAGQKFVHRDLAARNCMIDANFVIKVADFGLSENMYAKTYFRQDQDKGVKLPIKWLALESLTDGVFSEKTDVWAFGVTCWEVYSGGKTPYPGVAPMSLPGLLESGHRLEKPKNAACGDEIYTIVASCWNAIPKDRPPFSELAKRISGTLEPLADYMDFTSFGLHSKSTQNIVLENPAALAELEDIKTAESKENAEEDFDLYVQDEDKDAQPYLEPITTKSQTPNPVETKLTPAELPIPNKTGQVKADAEPKFPTLPQIADPEETEHTPADGLTLLTAEPEPESQVIPNETSVRPTPEEGFKPTVDPNTCETQATETI